ncbi:MAG TPA: patatin-like phospholipase family protein [Methylomusa anaerophila]|uniref:Patatin-like phospholipase n=1 Tax=Methylomusa anaerophila TaxID=1930071 RepID=A0A348AM90_9FIRM|nr:patatin-like phospholipase family protein [Methylomusa anaerophila]BBB92188.1 patatin-like phospholipase [Methylomusa anaerophila]HML87798.1 patatin-like phospholipase family protein [Methylomusa anaerophila]
MPYHFRNLVFEGGGVKGVAYAGSLQVLHEKGILEQIKRVGGTSVGSITALLVGLNYSIDEINNILSGLDFRRFLDDSWGIVRDVGRLLTQFGWYKGDFFHTWVENLIAAKTGKTNATFAQVYNLSENHEFKDIYFIGTNLSTGFSEVFSYEHTPQMGIADAVRISISVPLIFAARRSDRGDVYIDGGALNNYPVKLFDRERYVEQFLTYPDYYREYNQKLSDEGKIINPYAYNQETLGFRLDSAGEIACFHDHAEPPRHNINDFFSYTWRLIDTILECQENQHLHSDDWHRTIYIDTLGVKAMDFGIDNNTKQALINSGRENTIKYLKWFDSTESTPSNRP